MKLPFPPTANTYYRNVRGKVLISAKGREYRRTVQGIAMAERLPRFGKQRLSMKIEVYPPDRRRRDLDNLNKCLLDALEKAGIYDNDGQIDRLEIVRMPMEKPGFIRVGIEAI